MKGKNKCKLLKEIRQRIADENDIPYVTRECTYQGECRGTCPKCEAELRYLERELEKRQRLGKAVAVAAVAAGLSLSLSACAAKGVSAPGSGGTAAPTLPEPENGFGVNGDDPLFFGLGSGGDVIKGLIEAPTEEPILYGEMDASQTEESTEFIELAGDVVMLPDGPGIWDEENALPTVPETPEDLTD